LGVWGLILNNMTAEELTGITADLVVDARGTACPGPLLAAKKAIGEIES